MGSLSSYATGVALNGIAAFGLSEGKRAVEESSARARELQAEREVASLDAEVNS
jgi:hypothetical protein